MKSKLFSMLLCAFLGIYAVNGQVDFFNNSEETARRLDSIEGRDTPQRRENRDNNRNNNNGDSERNNELRERWEEMFGGPMAAFMEDMDRFNTAETRCIFIMVIYLDAYMDIVDTTFEANDCRTKSDGYALQALAIGAATSIMYCPESLANLTEAQKNHIWAEDFMPIMENEDNRQFIMDWKAKYRRIGGADPRIDRNTIDALTEFFHPNNIIAKLLNVQQNIEELNCPD
jgi:hypothetical protein